LTIEQKLRDFKDNIADADSQSVKDSKLREIKKLEKLIRQERSHGQWFKQGLNFACLSLLII